MTSDDAVILAFAAFGIALALLAGWAVKSARRKAQDEMSAFERYMDEMERRPTLDAAEEESVAQIEIERRRRRSLHDA